MSQQWHYTRAGQRLGPVSASELKRMASSGELAPNDLVWKEGMPKWVPAEKLDGLFTATTAHAAPPPLPQQAGITTTSLLADYSKPIGAILVALGGIVFVLAAVRLNSDESQSIREFGGSDPPATARLLIGIPLILIGIVMLTSTGLISTIVGRHIAALDKDKSTWHLMAIQAAAWVCFFAVVYLVEYKFKKTFAHFGIELGDVLLFALKLCDWVIDRLWFIIILGAAVVFAGPYGIVRFTDRLPSDARRKIWVAYRGAMLAVPLVLAFFVLFAIAI